MNLHEHEQVHRSRDAVPGRPAPFRPPRNGRLAATAGATGVPASWWQPPAPNRRAVAPPRGVPAADGRWAATLQNLLAPADVRLNGDRPWDLRVHDTRFCRRVLSQGSLALGETYMDGWWDCDRLDGFFERILRAGLDARVVPARDKLRLVWARLTNPGRRALAFQIGRHHYDLGNRLYEGMLDKHMIYSCGYWRTAGDIDQAQEAKLDLLCRKLGLSPGMRLLDIGCGWGGTVRYAARHYGVSAVGITVSAEQAAEARRRCAGLPVEIRLQDYRDVDERFERIVSVGMIEHVGVKNYPTFFTTARRHLADDGLFVLHTIGSNRSRVNTDPWIARYIFPNSMLPSARQLCQAAEPHFIIEDWHNFGTDYDRTLMAWAANFEKSWPAIETLYDEHFKRMWRYYLLSCAGAFRARDIQVWQIVFSPHGVPGGYVAPR